MNIKVNSCSVVCKARHLNSVLLQVSLDALLYQVRLRHSHLVLVDQVDDLFGLACLFGMRVVYDYWN